VVDLNNDASRVPLRPEDGIDQNQQGGVSGRQMTAPMCAGRGRMLLASEPTSAASAELALPCRASALPPSRMTATLNALKATPGVERSRRLL
jgi:hypothetical protein